MAREMAGKSCLIIILILLAAFLCSGIVFAQMLVQLPKRELLLFEEIPIVTSASKHAERLIEAPAAISVITSEDIENMDYVNLWDFFRRVPGVDVATFDGRAGFVAPRGFSERFTRRNQLLIDGRSSYSPLFGGTEWDYIPIFPEDIERIEVIRGPNATLYGSNAFTGVINITTKEPKDAKGLLLKEGAGTHGYQRSLLRYGDTVGKLDYRVGYSYHYDYGYGSSDGKDVNDDERDHTTVVRGKYNIDDLSNLELLAGVKVDKGRPVNVASNSTTTRSHILSDFQMARYNTKVFDDQDFYIQIFRNEVTENKHGGAIHFASNESEVKQYDIELQHVFKWFKEMVDTVWGFSFRYNQGGIYLFDSTSTGVINKRFGGDPLVDRIYRLFANNDIKLNEYWTLVLGAMFENNGFTGGSISPRTSVLFSPTENHTLRATYARAYRTPTMLEDRHNHTAGGFTTRGNTSLKNEVVDAYELGYTSWLCDNRLKMGAQGYLNEYKNIQDIVQLNATTFSTDNSNYARAKGVELETEFNPKDWVKYYTNVTFEEIKDTNFDFKDSHPKFKVNFGSRFKMDNLGVTANFDGYYVDTYKSKDLEDTLNRTLKVDPYLRFDFRVAKTFFKGNLEWAVKGENLFDQSHLEARSGTTPVDANIERTVYTTVSAKF